MTAILAAWNRFFFAEQSPVPLALFRIVYGLLVTMTVLLLKADWISWYGTHAWMSLDTMRELEPGVRLNLFTILPQDDRWIIALFWIFLASAVLLTVGFLSRLNSMVVYFCLASIQQRNLYILHGGDTFLRVAGFFLIFAPAGAALSVDRLIRVWRGREQSEVPARRLWAQRMIQIELSLMYLATFCWKLKGAAWMEGSALFYVFHLFELQRFPLPDWLLEPGILKLGTWFAMVLEFSLGTLIWVKRMRYKALAAGLLFHLSLEYSLNIPMFQWDVLSAYVLFVDPGDLQRAWNWICARVSPWLGEPVTVLYDRHSGRARRLVNLLIALDIFRRLTFKASIETGDRTAAEGEGHKRELVFATPSGPCLESDARKILAKAIPLLWPLMPCFYVWRVVQNSK
jgi:Vitamin K-dependent gamma-carboxylase